MWKFSMAIKYCREKNIRRFAFIWVKYTVLIVCSLLLCVNFVMFSDATTITGVTPPADDWYKAGVTLVGSNGTYTTGASEVYNFTVPNRARIGHRTPTTMQYLYGNLAELILYSRALNDTDRQIIEGNQGAYFGIVGMSDPGGTNLSIDMGGQIRTATQISGNGTNTHIYRYTVQVGDNDSDGIEVISPMTGIIVDDLGDPATLTFNLPDTTGVIVDTTPPNVSDIVRKTPTSTTINATSVVYTVNFNEEVSGVDISDFELAITGTIIGGFDTGEIYTIDKTAPILTSVSIASNNAISTLAKVGDTIMVSFTSSKTLGLLPTATIAGQSAIVTNTGGNDYTATYVMTSDDTEGAVIFAINFADVAGNSGAQVIEVTNWSL